MKLPYSEPKSIEGDEISPWHLGAHPEVTQRRAGSSGGLLRRGLRVEEEPLTASAGAEANIENLDILLLCSQLLTGYTNH